MTVDTWNLVTLWHDKTANEICIQIDEGTADCAAHTLTTHDATGAVLVGSANAGVSTFDGRIDQAGFWKERVLSSADISFLYNSGNGRAYSELQ